MFVYKLYYIKEMRTARDFTGGRYHRGSNHKKGGMCSTTTIIVIVVIGVILLLTIIGAGTGIAFALTSNVISCTTHEECLTKNPCTEDKCDMDAKLCISDKIEGCCVEDKDCGASPCYNAFCDAKSFTCRLHPPLNGTICDDFNDCTIDDRCVGYKCEGKRLTCDTGGSCSSGVCLKGSGCIFTAALDGIGCNDNNKCTVGDQCWKGMCASGIQKDCSHYNTVCARGVCDTNTGDCVSVPINERQACDDGLICTIQDQCIAGKCRGEEDMCYDNNPCTINKCVEGIGCMLRYEDFNKTCSTTCDCDDQCPEGYTCADGTCVQMGYTGSQIRFLDYEIEMCASGGHRLVMEYALDSNSISIGDDTRYLIPRTLGDITSPTGQALGFIYEKRNLQSMIITNDLARSAFTLTTRCQNVTIDNCDTIFSMREYQFYVKLHHCLSTSPNEENCLDNNIVVAASIQLSIRDCTQFTQFQFISLYGTGVLYALGKKYIGIVDETVLKTGLDYITVGYETPAYTNPNVIVMTTNFRMCRPDINHYLKDCVSGKDTHCLKTGCYDWDPNDTPIIEHYDIMVNSVVTPLAKTSWETTTCYNEDDYNSPSSVKCSENKCPSTTNGIAISWPGPMDDGFHLNTLPIKSWSHIPREWTFDMKIKLHMCNHTLRSSNNIYHNIVTLVI